MAADSGAVKFDLAQIPRFTLLAGAVVYRVHLQDHHPWFFGSGETRFSLPQPHGTCYLATKPLGAFMETLGRAPTIDRSRITERRLSALMVSTDTELLDLRSNKIVGAGLDASVSAGTDLGPSQMLAVSADTHGLMGVAYPVRHSPDGLQTGIALFADSGEHRDRPVLGTDRISDSLIADAAQIYGVSVEPLR